MANADDNATTTAATRAEIAFDIQPEYVDTSFSGASANRAAPRPPDGRCGRRVAWLLWHGHPDPLSNFAPSR